MYIDGLFDLIDIIKNRFKKKSKAQELEEYFNSEMPGAHKPFINVIQDYSDIETIRKTGL